MATVRVVVPTYNRVAMLEECIQSVLDQTFKDFNLVIVDDGSTDGTEALLERLSSQDPRVRYVKQPNTGVAGARNRGIAGDESEKYVAFLDSDDIWNSSHLEKSVKVLEDYPEVCLVCARRDCVDVQGMLARDGTIDLIERKFARALGEAIPAAVEGVSILPADASHRLLLRGQFVPWTSSVVVRRVYVNREAWFDTQLEVLEDVDLFLDLASRPFALISASAGRYRYFGDNLTASRALSSPVTLRRQKSVLRFQHRKIDKCRTRDDLVFVRAEVAGTSYLIGQCCDEQDDISEARRAYRDSLRSRVTWKAIKGVLAVSLPRRVRGALNGVLRSW